jgi:hypothetical protein
MFADGYSGSWTRPSPQRQKWETSSRDGLCPYGNVAAAATLVVIDCLTNTIRKKWRNRAALRISDNIFFAASLTQRAERIAVWYHVHMTKLLDAAIERLRQLPATMQDSAAQAVIRQLEEEPEAGDREAVAEGRGEFQRGDFVTLDQLRDDMGLGDH